MAWIGEKRDVQRVEVGKSHGKRPLRSPTDGRLIKVDLLVGQKDVDWIDLAHNMDKWLVLVNKSRDFVTSSRTISLSRTPIQRVSFIPGSPLAARSRAVVRSHI